MKKEIKKILIVTGAITIILAVTLTISYLPELCNAQSHDFVLEYIMNKIVNTIWNIGLLTSAIIFGHALKKERQKKE